MWKTRAPLRLLTIAGPVSIARTAQEAEASPALLNAKLGTISSADVYLVTTEANVNVLSQALQGTIDYSPAPPRVPWTMSSGAGRKGDHDG
jgi:hypothetical protein